MRETTDLNMFKRVKLQFYTTQRTLAILELFIYDMIMKFFFQPSKIFFRKILLHNLIKSICNHKMGAKPISIMDRKTTVIYHACKMYETKNNGLNHTIIKSSYATKNIH